MRKLSIYLDDVRMPPDGWFLCRTAEEVIHFLEDENIEVARLSLNHDLGIPREEGMDGYDLVKWMAEWNEWPAHKPTVHGMSPVGRDNMLAVIDHYFKEPEGETNDQS